VAGAVFAALADVRAGLEIGSPDMTAASANAAPVTNIATLSHHLALKRCA